MRPRDIGQAMEIEKLCFSSPWSKTMFESELSNPACTYFTAFEHCSMLGYVGMSEVLDEGYINNLAVCPKQQRRGIALRLMQALIVHAKSRKLAFLSLEVRFSNAPAIALYEQLGFERVGLRPAYYELPCEDAILMTLFL